MMALAERIARLRERVRAAVSHVDLFPLVRGLERELSRDTPIGSDGPPRDECVAFSHPPDFRVPAGEVLSIEGGPASGGPSVVVRTALLGLLGTESPLPPGISEGVLFDDDEASLAFIDVFQHRALALLYRAWKRRAPSMALERSPDDAFPRALQSLAGTDAFSPYPGVDGLDPMFALGLSDVARCDPGFLDSSALEYLVRRTFPDLNARVTTPEPRIIEARPEDMTTLGTTRCTLGDDASYGVSAFDAAGFVQIEIGPVTRSTYEALLPGGEAFRRLQPLVSSWLASRCVAELVITMPVDEAPALSLGNEYGGKLGTDAGYYTPDTGSVRVRVSLAGASADPNDGSIDLSLAVREPQHAESSRPFTVPADAVGNVWEAASTLLDGATLPAAVSDALMTATAAARDGHFDVALDVLIAAIDGSVARVLDDVMHNPAFQALEASWRGLAYVVTHAPADENVQLRIWNCSKEELSEDLAGATELVRSRAFATIYTAELGTFGGQPYGAILADMSVESTARDVQLVGHVSAIATIAHAPFFIAPNPRLLQLQSWRELPDVRSASAIFESPAFGAWNSMRNSDDARAAGVLLGRPLFRSPYSSESGVSFPYTETIGAEGDALLFGNPVYVLASRLIASFARHRTLAAIVGDDVDACASPVSFPFPSLGERHLRAPLEVTVTPRLEKELRGLGFIALTSRTGGDRLFLPSASSLQAEKSFGGSRDGRQATLNHMLSSKLPYFFVACRFAHYIKVLEREMIGAHRSADEIEARLNDWLSEYVIEMNAAPLALRARYPLRSARVRVAPVDGAAGWFRGEVAIRPHLRYLDRFFTLSVRSWLSQTTGVHTREGSPQSQRKAGSGDSEG